MKRALRTTFTLIALLPSLAFGWGFDGHRKLASMLQDPLPAGHCLRTWYASKQTASLQDRACDPDRWRYTSAGADYDPNEWPRHYLEVDWVSPAAAYPRDLATAMATFPQYFEKNGRVPWRVEEKYAVLVQAFRANDTAAILDATFLLSHYVTDSFSLLHDTKDYDPGPGLHSRWESQMVSSHLSNLTTASLAYVGTAGKADPKNNIFDIVIAGNAVAPQLAAAHFANPTDDAAFYAAVKDMTARRWGDAVTLLGSIVWSAWAEAGAPNLAGFGASCSKTVPTQEIVLKGYPPAGGFTHPDGGNPALPDASVTVVDGGPTDDDGGCLDGTCGGMGGGMEGSGGGSGGGDAMGGGGELPASCGCATAPGAFALALLALAWLRAQKRAAK